MSYEAIVCELKNVRPHPNADRLQLATVSGYQIIVGLEQKENDIGVFFACDGCLSYEHCMNNDLYQYNPETGKVMGGYFGKNGRVKSQKLRGEKSDGFWQPLAAFEWTGVDLDTLSIGDQFSSLNGQAVCEKYYTPATVKAMNKNNPKKGKGNKNKKIDRSMLHEHYSTKQVRHYINKIPENSVLYISEKLHGTSGRTGHIQVKVSTNKWQRFCIRVSSALGGFGNKQYKNKRHLSRWEHVSGTRRVVMDPGAQKDGFYKNANFREDIHQRIASVGLHKNEVIYYEIVGYTDTGGLIMGAHTLEDKKLKKLYGNAMKYTYGCKEALKENKIFVYRIAMINQDGIEVDLSRVQVEARCKELGLDVVPVLAGPIIYKNKEELLTLLEEISDGPSTLDNTHVREGVVVRIEHADMFESLKYKGWTFCDLEGIAKNSDDYVDPEEIA